MHIYDKKRHTWRHATLTGESCASSMGRLIKLNSRSASIRHPCPTLLPPMHSWRHHYACIHQPASPLSVFILIGCWGFVLKTIVSMVSPQISPWLVISNRIYFSYLKWTLFQIEGKIERSGQSDVFTLENLRNSKPSDYGTCGVLCGGVIRVSDLFPRSRTPNLKVGGSNPHAITSANLDFQKASCSHTMSI